LFADIQSGKVRSKDPGRGGKFKNPRRAEQVEEVVVPKRSVKQVGDVWKELGKKQMLVEIDARGGMEKSITSLL
jgi:hypothetical protein